MRPLSTQGGDPHAAVAELNLFGPGQAVLPRERWQVAYVDTEELKAEKGSADNALDGNAETYWHTGWSGVTLRQPQPHALVIDLGEVVRFEGLRYLPRQEDKPGRIKAFKLYARERQFDGLR